VSFPFDLRSAAVFDSHIPCRSHAVALPCHHYAFLKATSQGHGRVHGGVMACWRLASFHPLAATMQSSRKFVIRNIPISDAGGQGETKQRLSWTRRSLLFLCKDMSARIIYNTKIMITISKR
jgi:hypothetical protein